MGDSSALVTAAGIDINTGISAMALRNSTLARNAIEDASEHPGGRGGRKGSQQPGKLYAFGSGDYGRLGHGDNQPKKTAKLIDILRDKNIIKFSCGPRHTLALAGDGTVWSWGYGGDGQLGHGDYQLQTMPVQVKALKGEHVIDLQCGDKHSAVLTSGGDVFTWGDSSLGQLGLGDFRKQHSPHRVMELQGKMVLQISCGPYHTACIDKDEQVYTWGRGAHGRLGLSRNLNKRRPTPVVAWPPSFRGCRVRGAALGGAHTLVLAEKLIPSGLVNPWGSKRTLYAWGYVCAVARERGCAPPVL